MRHENRTVPFPGASRSPRPIEAQPSRIRVAAKPQPICGVVPPKAFLSFRLPSPFRGTMETRSPAGRRARGKGALTSSAPKDYAGRSYD